VVENLDQTTRPTRETVQVRVPLAPGCALEPYKIKVRASNAGGVSPPLNVEVVDNFGPRPLSWWGLVPAGGVGATAPPRVAYVIGWALA